MATIKYDKIVRDRIPEIIESDSKQCVTKQVSGREKLQYLYKKLVEETNELSESSSIEELADVQEVVYAIANELGVSLNEIECTRRQKAEERGGFEKGIVLLEVNNPIV